MSIELVKQELQNHSRTLFDYFNKLDSVSQHIYIGSQMNEYNMLYGKSYEYVCCNILQNCISDTTDGGDILLCQQHIQFKKVTPPQKRPKPTIEFTWSKNIGSKITSNLIRYVLLYINGKHQGIGQHLYLFDTATCPFKIKPGNADNKAIADTRTAIYHLSNQPSAIFYCDKTQVQRTVENAAQSFTEQLLSINFHQNQSSYVVNTTKQHKNDNDREYLQCILDGSV